MTRVGRALAALAMIALPGCGTSGVVVGDEGVGVNGRAGNVSAAIGPDDAAVVVAGDRVVAGADSEQAAAGARLDGHSPLIIGGGTSRGGGAFGGVGMGF